MALMSITEYARHRNVSQPAVSKAISAGRIKKERNGKIDSEKADTAWALKTDPVRSLNNAPRQQPAPTPRPAQASEPSSPLTGTENLGIGEKVALKIAMQRLRKETAQADTAEMERDEKKDRLMKRSVVDEHIAFFSQMVRDHMMAMPDRLAPAVAAVTDAGTARRVLMNDVETGLRKLSRAIASAGF